jgi:predicted amidohydrolase
MLTLAMIQQNQPDDVGRGIASAVRYCHDAADAGAAIVLFPEMWTTGYRFFDPAVPDTYRQWLAQAVAENDDLLTPLRRAARERRLTVAFTFLRKTPGKPENSCIVIDERGNSALLYSKVHICEFSTEGACTAGRDFLVADVDIRGNVVRIGVMICFDREHPESARVLAAKGVDLILVPNACVIEDHRIAQLKTRAFENVVGIAMANYPEPVMNGNSLAVDASFFDRQGNGIDPVLCLAGPNHGIYLSDFDIAAIRRAQRESIWGQPYRRPSAYRVLLDDQIVHLARSNSAPTINGNAKLPMSAG